MKKWEYAELSHMAKLNGGPDNLVKKLINSGKLKMLPWVGVAFVGGIVVDKGVGYLMEKKKQHDAEVEAAKQALIQGINEYDAAHPDDQDEETQGA